jgi:serine/threonine-protein kinase
MKYKRIAKLGHGGMATVSLAVASGPAGFNKLLVLKELRAELADDPDFVNMFLDEARLSAKLQHPAIVHTYDVVQEGEACYLVMEYLQGQPLSRVRPLKEWKDFPLGLHLRCISTVLDALHHAHELKDYDGLAMNMVHRDVSPQNVFLCYDGQVKLLDFGVAKARGALSRTEAGVVKGKLAYVAPEVMFGEPIDRRADLFGIGVMLWEALARKKISSGRSDIEISGARVSGTDPALQIEVEGAAPELGDICRKAMAFKPGDRYQTAAEMKAEIDKHIPPTATLEALGAHVSREFADERERIRKLIEEHINKAQVHEIDSSSLPSLQMTGSNGSRGSVVESPPTVVSATGEPSRRRRTSTMWVVGISVVVLAAVGVAVTSSSWRDPPPNEAPLVAAAESASSPVTHAALEKPPEPEPVAMPVAEPAKVAEASAEPAAATTKASTGWRASRAAPEPKAEPSKPANTTPTPPATGEPLGPGTKKEARPIIEADPYGR